MKAEDKFRAELQPRTVVKTELTRTKIKICLYVLMFIPTLNLIAKGKQFGDETFHYMSYKNDEAPRSGTASLTTKTRSCQGRRSSAEVRSWNVRNMKSLHFSRPGLSSSHKLIIRFFAKVSEVKADVLSTEACF